MKIVGRGESTTWTLGTDITIVVIIAIIVVRSNRDSVRCGMQWEQEFTRGSHTGDKIGASAKTIANCRGVIFNAGLAHWHL